MMNNEEKILELLSVLVEDNKEIKIRLDKLETRLEKLEYRLDKVENRIDSLENRITGLENRMDKLEAGQTEIKQSRKSGSGAKIPCG